jgi:pimeloyl-ACP methyl ester carboxylesterase
MFFRLFSFKKAGIQHLLVPVFLFLLASCNIPRMVDRFQYRSMQREGFCVRTIHHHDAKQLIHYSLKEGKPKVLLLTGYGASGPGQYLQTVKLLKDSCSLIIPDLLSFGHSTYSGNNHSISTQVEHLKSALDSLNIHDSLIVVGNSYGGIVGAYFAEAYPNLVKKYVAYDSPLCEYRRAYADSVAMAMGLPDVEHILSPAHENELRKALTVIYTNPPKIPRFVLRQATESAVPLRDSQLLWIKWLSANEIGLNDHSFNIQCHVYLLWGQNDRLVPVSACYAISKRLSVKPNRIIIRSTWSHAGNVEFPDEFAEVMMRIVREN